MKLSIPLELEEKSIVLHTNEKAWRYDDALQLIEYAYSNSILVLGGDVLTTGREYTYDNWYYEFVKGHSLSEHTKKSCDLARAYIDAYCGRNGWDYLFVLVLSREPPIEFMF